MGMKAILYFCILNLKHIKSTNKSFFNLLFWGVFKRNEKGKLVWEIIFFRYSKANVHTETVTTFTRSSQAQARQNSSMNDEKWE